MSMIKSMLKSQPKLFLLARSMKHRLLGLPETELLLLPALVDRKRIAIDVGAHNGLYSEALSKLASHVVAIEAIPELAQGLAYLLPTVEVIHAAASDREGRITLSIPDGKPGLSSVAHTGFSELDTVRKVEVDAITLDGLFAGRDDKIGFIKVDVEGHELAVLKGARTIIEKHRPILLIEAEERHCAGTVASLFEYFKSINYSGFFYDGALSSLENFDPAFHQSLEGVDLVELDHGNFKGRYVNNFVFIP